MKNGRKQECGMPQKTMFVNQKHESSLRTFSFRDRVWLHPLNEQVNAVVEEKNKPKPVAGIYSRQTTRLLQQYRSIPDLTSPGEVPY